ncbi:MAG: hypothetical protein WAQ98_09590 [Blastocatellia bacterium]
MSVATENTVNTMQINHNNNFYQQGADNNNDWATKRKSFGDDNFSDIDIDDVNESNKDNKQSGNVSIASQDHDHSNLSAIKSPTKEQTKPKKKSKSTSSSIVVEPGQNQNTTIYFQLSLAEHNKLNAIATLLGYENANDFAKELFLNSLNPYFSVAAQSLRQQLFNEVNQANFNQLSQASQYAQTQATQYAQASDSNELNYSNEQQQT